MSANMDPYKGERHRVYKFTHVTNVKNSNLKIHLTIHKVFHFITTWIISITTHNSHQETVNHRLFLYRARCYLNQPISIS